MVRPVLVVLVVSGCASGRSTPPSPPQPARQAVEPSEELSLEELQREVREEAILPSCPAVADAYEPDPAEVDAVASAALLHFVQHPDTIPDSSLLPANKLVRVVDRTVDGVPLSSRAIPDQSLRDLDLRTTKDIQWEADRMDGNIPFLEISVDLAGDCAVVTLSPAIMSPTRSREIHLCCCSQKELYEKQGGRWYRRFGRSGVCS